MTAKRMDGGLNGDAIEAAAAIQGIELAPARAERIAPALSASLEAALSAAPPLEFETEPASHSLSLGRCKA